MNQIKLRNSLALIAFVLVILLFAPTGYYVVKPSEPILTSSYLGDEIKSENGNFYTSPVRYFVNVANIFGTSEINANALSYLTSYFVSNSKRIKLNDFIAKDTDSEMYSQYLNLSTREGEIFVKAAVLSHLNVSYELLGEGVVVGALTENSAVRDSIKQGDLIVGMNGNDIITTADLIRELNSGVEVFEIVFENSSGIHSIELDSSLALGVYPYTKNIQLISDDDFSVEILSATGTSGGLMISLEVLNAILEEDLLGGREIAGSGTILPNGEVRSVENIDLKIIGAQESGMDLFLIPEGNLVDIENKEFDIEIVSVKNLSDAVDKLKEFI